MTKTEINKKIYELQSDEEIINFVKERLNELETSSVEKTVGQNYTDSFQDYISQKTHYRAAEKFDRCECPDLVYDDITPYINLIKDANFEIPDEIISQLNDIRFGNSEDSPEIKQYKADQIFNYKVMPSSYSKNVKQRIYTIFGPFTDFSFDDI